MLNRDNQLQASANGRNLSWGSLSNHFFGRKLQIQKGFTGKGEMLILSSTERFTF